MAGELDSGQLISQLRSEDNDLALEAVDLLRARGWLGDGLLHEANLNGANLRGAEMAGADLMGVDFLGANLQEATFSGANLEGAVLRHSRAMRTSFFNPICPGPTPARPP